ncbi:Hypothetical protein NTJ_02242 [Nesidiocoris tenuis]|uniref:Uncharacterized protein n=1 Tax=Nesidiocoris tenuis TaxID=355587 RepID=A0ABN7ADM0_9HEMI|nr:Hypothetical protein NTJ_02242 [Nesidiocoris tenuis]
MYLRIIRRCSYSPQLEPWRTCQASSSPFVETNQLDEPHGRRTQRRCFNVTTDGWTMMRKKPPLCRIRNVTVRRR